MKRAFILIVLALGCRLSATAQGYDTIYNRCNSWYQEIWYDSCPGFLTGDYVRLERIAANLSMPDYRIARPYYVDHRMGVKGLVVTTIANFSDISLDPYWHNDYSLPEYAILYRYGHSLDSLVAVDSVRWDTVKPKVFAYPKDNQFKEFYYAYAYEVYFDSTIYVYDSFYIGGTHNSNVKDGAPGGVTGFYLYKPTVYAGVFSQGDIGCAGSQPIHWFGFNGCWTRSSTYDTNGYAIGGFFAIIDRYNLVAVSADESAGIVTGSGSYENLASPEITAIPYPHSRFTAWNDGDTTNPRVVYLTQDTTFTAYFETCQPAFGLTLDEIDSLNVNLSWLPGEHNISWELAYGPAVADPDSFAVVDCNDIRCTLQGLTPGTKYAARVRGVCFNDSVYSDWSDTIQFHVAEYNPPIGIPSVNANAPFTLTPNPAHDYVVLDLKDGVSDPKHCTLTVSDASGREVLSLNIAAPHTRINTHDLPKGMYFVTLTTPKGSSTQKLIVE